MIGEIVSSTQTVVSSTTTVLDAVKAMTQNRTGACVVIDGDRLTGLFTERDVMSKVVLRQLDPAKVQVGSVCTRQLITATPQTPEAHALRTMVGNHIRHLPIIDVDGTFVGMLSLRKLLQHRVDELGVKLDSLHAYLTDDALGG